MRWLLPWVLVAACAGSLAPATPQTTASEDRSAAVAVYWDHPRAGTNMFSSFPSVRRFRAARDAGIRMVRLVPDPWQGLERDFLIGDADDYQGLVAGDLQRLRTVLDLAHHADLRVVLAMLSLPGARWRQHNDDANDVRLWADPSYAEQAARFWGDLSRELSRHPGIVAYNPINEPRADDPTQIRTVYARIVRAHRARRGQGRGTSVDRWIRTLRRCRSPVRFSPVRTLGARDLACEPRPGPLRKPGLVPGRPGGRAGPCGPMA
ncbi:MAG: hypothetical protein AAF627_21545 [Myxococcota bacterium]